MKACSVRVCAAVSEPVSLNAARPHGASAQPPALCNPGGQNWRSDLELRTHRAMITRLRHARDALAVACHAGGQRSHAVRCTSAGQPFAQTRLTHAARARGYISSGASAHTCAVPMTLQAASRAGLRRIAPTALGPRSRDWIHVSAAAAVVRCEGGRAERHGANRIARKNHTDLAVPSRAPLPRAHNASQSRQTSSSLRLGYAGAHTRAAGRGRA